MSNPKCVLYDRGCTGCGECDHCDLDPEKICDNCMKCISSDAEYKAVLIDRVICEDSKPEESIRPSGNQQ